MADQRGIFPVLHIKEVWSELVWILQRGTNGGASGPQQKEVGLVLPNA